MTFQIEQLLTAVGVPDFDRMIDASGNDPAAVGVEGSACHRCFVSLIGAQFPAGAGVPELEDLVSAARENPFAVRAVHDRGHGGLVAGQGLYGRGAHLPFLPKLPNLNGFIGASGGNSVCLWIERRRPDRTTVSCEIAEALGSIEIPQAQGLVLARRGNLPSVRTERHRGDLVTMPAQRAQRLSAGDVPEAKRAVVASRDKQFAVLAVGQAGHCFRVPFEDLRLIAVHVVDLDQIVRAANGKAPAQGMKGDLVKAGLARRNGTYRCALRVCIPKAHHAVVAGAGNHFSIWTISHRADDKSGYGILESQLAVGHVVDIEDALGAARRQALAVRTESHGGDHPLEVVEGTNGSPC